jgi:nucleotide-binding universal stress UspA family protein
METDPAATTVGQMHDDLLPCGDALDEVAGATPPLFRHSLVAGEDEAARLDAAHLEEELAGRGETVTDDGSADLIVTGSAAAGRPGRVSLGPAGRDLLEGAACPVAVAPRGFAGVEHPEIRRIDVGIDGSRESGAALTLAVRIARAKSARLRLVAVAELGFELGGAPRGTDPREVERLARHLEHAADGLAGTWVESVLREGLADQILCGLAAEADLLVLGSRAGYADGGHASLGSVAERVLRAAPCPVAIAPAP